MTTEAPAKPRYRRNDLLPKLISQVTCCTPEDVKAWGMHAPLSYDTQTQIYRIWCNDCTPEYRDLMRRHGRCNMYELNGANFVPVLDDSDFDEEEA